jgi:hypothetical protein
MQFALGGEVARVNQRGLKIITMLDQLGSPRPHGAILFHAVAPRHHDCGGEVVPPRGKRDCLSVIAASRGDYSANLGLPRDELCHIVQQTANFERAQCRVIFVLHP